MLLPFAGDPFSTAVEADGVVIAVFGGHPVGEARWATWFCATDDFLRHGARASVAIRRFIADWQAAHPGITLDCYSTVDERAAPTWFRFLGFEPIYKCPSYTQYRYVVN